MYKQQRPTVNMCFPPLAWQTYDIYFTAARYDAQNRKIQAARISVLHNGEPVHSGYELVAKTGAGQPEGPQGRPILLQNHSNPVHFRNIWIVMTGSPSVAVVPNRAVSGCYFWDDVCRPECCW